MSDEKVDSVSRESNSRFILNGPYLLNSIFYTLDVKSQIDIWSRTHEHDSFEIANQTFTDSPHVKLMNSIPITFESVVPITYVHVAGGYFKSTKSNETDDRKLLQGNIISTSGCAVVNMIIMVYVSRKEYMSYMIAHALFQNTKKLKERSVEIQNQVKSITNDAIQHNKLVFQFNKFQNELVYNFQHDLFHELEIHNNVIDDSIKSSFIFNLPSVPISTDVLREKAIQRRIQRGVLSNSLTNLEFNGDFNQALPVGVASENLTVQQS